MSARQIGAVTIAVLAWALVKADLNGSNSATVATYGTETQCYQALQQYYVTQKPNTYQLHCVEQS